MKCPGSLKISPHNISILRVVKTLSLDQERERNQGENTEEETHAVQRVSEYVDSD